LKGQLKTEQKGWLGKRWGSPNPLPVALTISALLTLALASCQVVTQFSATATATLRPIDTPVATIAPPTPTSSPTPILTFTPTPSPGATQTADRSPLTPQERTTLEAVAEEVEQLRELASDAPLALAFMTPEELSDWLVGELAEDYSPQEAHREARVYAALELLPPDTDLYSLILALYTEQVAGFYDHEMDHMTVVGDEASLDIIGKITFAHEHLHALQDQFLGLDTLQTYRETADDDDAVRAVTALIEGDAQMVTALYLLNHLSEVDVTVLDGVQTGDFDAAPLILREEMLFPYLDGLAFVQALYGRGGWDAVNDAYDAPPQSTEQILHPEKYLAGEAPIAVSLPPLTSTLRSEPQDAGPGADWQLVEENTLGEFLLHLYLDVHLPGTVAQDASAGWGGDRFALYEHSATGDSLLLIVIVWDDEAEGAEFASAYAAFAGDKYGGASTFEDALGTWWQGENEITLLSAGKGQTIIVVGSEADAVEHARQALAGMAH